MRKIYLPILFYALLSQPCMAQGPEAEKDAMLFLESISMPKKAVVCSARLAGFTSKFDPAYAKWKDANAALLARGEAFLRAEATAAKMDFNFHVTLLAEMAAKSLASASQSILEENCDDLLQILGTSRSE